MRPIITNILAACILALFVSSAGPARPQVSGSEILQGKLGFKTGTGPVVEAAGKTTTLSARNSYLFHTLGDERLRNREVRLEGTQLPDGSFQVDQLFTVRDGRLYRVRYYCETCNIVALEPGPCVCCQQPTELQEVPVDKTDKHVFTTK
jgi:hypothetical protein